MTTFAQLQAAASAMEIIHGNLADRIDEILDSARSNADDTIYVEKARAESEYDAVALATVSDVLAFTRDDEVHAWFKSHGVEA